MQLSENLYPRHVVPKPLKHCLKKYMVIGLFYEYHSSYTKRHTDFPFSGFHVTFIEYFIHPFIYKTLGITFLRCIVKESISIHSLFFRIRNAEHCVYTAIFLCNNHPCWYSLDGYTKSFRSSFFSILQT